MANEESIGEIRCFYYAIKEQNADRICKDIRTDLVQEQSAPQ
nr:MAG TPA: hypothetical protein [Caudoviricetes sp.]